MDKTPWMALINEGREKILTIEDLREGIIELERATIVLREAVPLYSVDSLSGRHMAASFLFIRSAVRILKGEYTEWEDQATRILALGELAG